ncbi:MAG: hypothetical protein KAI24_02910 [Planctomycetes bacterium]|nr:hypothetical protein [Planctomycetota bacterium]
MTSATANLSGHLPAALSLALALAAPLATPLAGQAFHTRPPNDYGRSDDANAATRLNARLAAGDVALPAEGRRGRLLPLLRELGIPISSQTLVFSKTSLQRHRVSPHNPRALYFGADAYVGWIPGAASLEVIVGDDRLGLAFYTLAQDPERPPRLVRDDSCLRCHAGASTRSEPGLLLRSVFPDEDGDPITQAGDLDMDFRAPIAARWGGWLVTGRFEGEHRGNGTAVDDGRGGYTVAPRPARDLRAFADDFDPSIYPAATSDIGALLALEQQATIHNVIVRASLQTRYLLDKDRIVNELLDERGERPQTARIVDRLAREVTAALLLDGEADLTPHRTAPDPAFARAYASLWPRPDDGPQLGALDLRARTFTLPLSPMVLAPAFGRMPDALRRRVLRRLHTAIVRGTPPGAVRLTRPERTALQHLLRSLK